jgi:tellurite resistance protein TehA-like permease
MERKTVLWMILLSVIVLLVVGLSIPAMVKIPRSIPQPGSPPPDTAHQVQPQPPPGQDAARQLKTVVSFINIGLIIPLFIIYAGIYREMRSSFTLGLLAVIFALGMYAVTSNPLIVSLLGGRVGDIGLFQIIPDLCTTVALVILIRISLA